MLKIISLVSILLFITGCAEMAMVNSEYHRPCAVNAPGAQAVTLKNGVVAYYQIHKVRSKYNGKSAIKTEEFQAEFDYQKRGVLSDLADITANTTHAVVVDRLTEND